MFHIGRLRKHRAAASRPNGRARKLLALADPDDIHTLNQITVVTQTRSRQMSNHGATIMIAMERGAH
ncbi:hypothetical protein ACQP1V_09865 [Microtetraspora malaysiensis]|uniref:hypothetical protein n=1 Tax=Microtetraspora malaysiensis TaxID=161358 RepID=UPI003D93B9F6